MKNILIILLMFMTFVMYGQRIGITNQLEKADTLDMMILTDTLGRQYYVHKDSVTIGRDEHVCSVFYQTDTLNVVICNKEGQIINTFLVGIQSGLGNSILPNMMILTDSLGEPYYIHIDSLKKLLCCDVDNPVQLDLTSMLQGTYNGATMNEDLRTQTLIPLSEPYAGLGYTHVGDGGGETTTQTILDNNNIVDWVFVELRNKTDNTLIVETVSALIKNDGSVIGADGNPLTFPNLVDPEVFVSIKHRNHLGIMTASTVILIGTGTAVDMTSTTLYGTNAGVDLGGGVMGLWAGNANGDGEVKYQGVGNDNYVIRDFVLAHPGNVFNDPTFSVLNVYDINDVNMNGEVKYQGAGNDATIIQNNVLAHPGNVFNDPTYQIIEQLP